MRYLHSTTETTCTDSNTWQLSTFLLPYTLRPFGHGPESFSRVYNITLQIWAHTIPIWRFLQLVTRFPGAAASNDLLVLHPLINEPLQC
jgi:hypothetical protein